MFSIQLSASIFSWKFSGHQKKHKKLYKFNSVHSVRVTTIIKFNFNKTPHWKITLDTFEQRAYFNLYTE